MNIFYLDKRPDDAAEMHCDKHCVKMILEYAQMLSTAHRVLDEDDAHPDLYKIAHKNHPSTIWTRSSKQHYDWLFRLFRMLSAEYSIRFGLINDSRDVFKVHKTWDKLGKILEIAPKNIEDNGWVDPPQCMPDYCKDDIRCICFGVSVYDCHWGLFGGFWFRLYSVECFLFVQ